MVAIKQKSYVTIYYKTGRNIGDRFQIDSWS